MTLAKIVDDKKVLCPKCEKGLRETTLSFDLVQDIETGERYFEFTRLCDKCKGEYTYHITADFNKRVAIDEANLVKIKDFNKFE